MKKYDGDLLADLDDCGPFGRRRLVELGFVDVPDIRELAELLEVDEFVDEMAIEQGKAIRNSELAR